MSSTGGNGENGTGAAPQSESVTKVAEDVAKINIANDTKDTKDDANQENLDLITGLDPNDMKAAVHVVQSDPNSPYYSVSTFEELKLDPNLLKGIHEMNFVRPSKIQESALPLIMRDPPENMIGQAHNGSGKTATFTLGILHRISTALGMPQAVVLLPTRELARQTDSVFHTMGKFLNIKTLLAIRDADVDQYEGCHVVIGTPGTVLKMVNRARRGTPWLQNIKMLVLDEADNMIDAGADFLAVSIKIKKALPPNTQVLLFSATFADRVKQFMEKFAPKANKIVVSKEQLALRNVQQLYIDCGSEANKFQTLCDIYSLLQLGQSIVFVQRRNTSEQITKRLRENNLPVSLLHGGDMELSMRDEVLDQFRRGETKVLVTTNVLARGIDVPAVSLVVNYDIPVDRTGEADPETYLHRIGRAGRFGRKGAAINFVHDQRSKQLLLNIEAHFAKPINKAPEQIEELEELLAA